MKLKLRLGPFGRIVVTTIKAILVCRAQKIAPTFTTVAEIAVLASPLIPGGPPSDAEQQEHPPSSTGALPVANLLGLVFRVARGFAPAVVVAQGVRLVAGLVSQKRTKPSDGKVSEGNDVRALQLGLSGVPRVDPRVERTLTEYAAIYREWLLVLKGRLQQQAVDLPEELFGEAEDEELMRFALCYHILQARSLKDALVAMDRTLANVRDYVNWWPKYAFLRGPDLEAWQHITWWEGPDPQGYLWLVIDNRAAVAASKAHGPEPVARVLISNMEHGLRVLLPALECNDEIMVVVDNSGVNITQALRMRPIYQRVAHVLDRMYPFRLRQLYMVGLPFALRWAFRACLQFVHPETRHKMRICRLCDVPRQLPAQLHSHKVSVAAGLDSMSTHAGPESEAGADTWSEGVPATPLLAPRRSKAGGRGNSNSSPHRATMMGVVLVSSVLMYLALLQQLGSPGQMAAVALTQVKGALQQLDMGLLQQLAAAGAEALPGSVRAAAAAAAGGAV